MLKNEEAVKSKPENLKVYIGVKAGKPHLKYGMTVYNSEGKVVYSTVKLILNNNEKHNRHLESLLWGSKKLNYLLRTPEYKRVESVDILIGSKTIYNWLEKETAPKQYLMAFGNVMLELAFISKLSEVIYTGNMEKVLYKHVNSEEDKVVNVLDLLSVSDVTKEG